MANSSPRGGWEGAALSPFFFFFVFICDNMLTLFLPLFFTFCSFARLNKQIAKENEMKKIVLLALSMLMGNVSYAEYITII